MKIKKAIITAAGFGTRFLPATKVIPKEMLPVIDRPILQYLVEEAIGSGIKEIIFVVRPDFPLVQKHFQPQPSLEFFLKKQRRRILLKKIKEIEKMAQFHFLKQNPNLPYGNGTPLITARHLIKKGENFIYMFGDDLVIAKVPATKQLIKFWQKNPGAVVVATQEVPKKEVSHYGMVLLKKGSKNRIEEIIEKPKPCKVQSNLIVGGRFTLNREVIEVLDKQKLGKKGELWLADAISEYAQAHQVLAAPIRGKWLTTGDPLHCLKAMVELALARKDIGQEFKNFLQKLNVKT